MPIRHSIQPAQAVEEALGLDYHSRENRSGSLFGPRTQKLSENIQAMVQHKRLCQTIFGPGRGTSEEGRTA